MSVSMSPKPDWMSPYGPCCEQWVSSTIREWLEAHPRIRRAFIPVGTAWLNLIEGWWRIFRRKAFAGQSLADDHDIAYVTRIATQHLNRHANPWVWGRPSKPHRVLRRRFVYCL